FTALPRVSRRVERTILWETVPVNSTRRSGSPMLFRAASDFGKTLALQRYSRQISTYRRAIHSLPPTITTLMVLLLSELAYANCYVKKETLWGRGDRRFRSPLLSMVVMIAVAMPLALLPMGTAYAGLSLLFGSAKVPDGASQNGCDDKNKQNIH